MRIANAIAAGLGVLALSAPAGADLVEDECAELDRSRSVSCHIERSGAEWSLTTRLTVGGGAKAGVVAAETHFCEAARRAQASASVTRWNRLGGGLGEAKMEWSCAQPAVSAAPRDWRRH